MLNWVKFSNITFVIKKILALLLALVVLASLPFPSHAQVNEEDIPSATDATESAMATASAKVEELVPKQIDLTQPGGEQARRVYERLYQSRPLDSPDVLNIVEYTIQYAVRTGVPANIIILILLLPFIATMFVFSRQIIGIPTLEMLVPIALSAALVATGLFV